MTDDASIEGPVDGLSMDRRAALVSLAAVIAAAGCSNDVTRGPSRTTTGRPSTVGPTPPAANSSSTTGGAQGVTNNASSIEPSIAKTSGPDIVNGPRSRGEVALTFHGAGDRSLAEQILGDCAQHDARITVFAVGQWLAGAPSVGRQILEAGHELGNHTWSHQQMPGLSARVAND